MKKKNPGDVNAPEKFYASTISMGSVDLRKMAEKISYQSTLTPGDCYNVLSALEKNVIDELSEGKIVRLGELGTFRLSVSSEGKETEGEFTSNSIKKKRILFLPSKGLKEMLRNLNFLKLPPRVVVP